MVRVRVLSARHALARHPWARRVIETRTIRTPDVLSHMEAPAPEDYPPILTVSADAAARRPCADDCDEDFEFAFALDLLLDAIEQFHVGGWSSPQTRPTLSISDPRF